MLVVDDDSSIRDSLSRELRAAGFDAVTAADGRAGLAAFRLHIPEVLLTDLAMPAADGFALISAVRRFSRTPIIVLSVRGADVDKIRPGPRR